MTLNGSFSVLHVDLGVEAVLDLQIPVVYRVVACVSGQLLRHDLERHRIVGIMRGGQHTEIPPAEIGILKIIGDQLAHLIIGQRFRLFHGFGRAVGSGGIVFGILGFPAGAGKERRCHKKSTEQQREYPTFHI